MVTLLSNMPEAIASVNDRVRKALSDESELGRLGQDGVKFKFVWTHGVDEGLVASGHFETLLKAVAEFDDFSKDNNPHGERDFGSLTVEGEKIFFKFDYYDPSLKFGSENPLDNAKTVRVLTVMLPQEY